MTNLTIFIFCATLALMFVIIIVQRNHYRKIIKEREHDIVKYMRSQKSEGRNRKAGVICLLLLFATTSTFAQISAGGTPPSFYYETVNAELQSSVSLPIEFDVAAMRAEDDERELSHLPPRVGEIIPVYFTTENSGEWTTLPNGEKIWRLSIAAEDAIAIMLTYDRFEIPNGARLFIYNDDRSRVLGAYTEVNNPLKVEYATEFVSGDHITLEYVPASPDCTESPVVITGVVYGYNNLYVAKGDGQTRIDFGASDPCMINVTCSEGFNWYEQKQGVVRIVTNTGGSSYSLCSGAMINNTKEDLDGLVISAFHCYSGLTPQQINQSVYYFHYEHPTCSGRSDPTVPTITGATILVNIPATGGSDGILLRLNEGNQGWFFSNGVFFNGWDRRNIAATSGVCIHHPKGDVKKISTFTSAAYSAGPLDFGGGEVTAPNSAWGVEFAATANGHSVTQGGSSGSPLFNQNKQIVGTLSGGASNCDNPTGPEFYGKLWYHWDQYSTSANLQMKTYLDPINCGIEYMNGTYIQRIASMSAGTTTLNFGSVPAGTTSTAQTITMTVANLKGNITWTKSGTNASEFNVTPASLPSTGGTFSVTFSPASTGAKTATLTISSAGVSNITVTLSGTGATAPTITVNPTSLTFNNVLLNTTSLSQNITVTGTNLSGNITFTKSGANASEFSVTPASLPPAGGTFAVTFTPTASGARSATLTISSTGAANKTVTLSGTGVGFCGGTGLSTDPFQICTAADLALLATCTNSNGVATNGKYFKLINDINLDVAPYNVDPGWTPIGTQTNGFQGNFDGAGSTITGLYYNAYTSYIGLFGYLDAGTVTRVAVKNVNIIYSRDYVGGVAGRITNNSSLSDCYVTGDITGSGSIGGIVGNLLNSSTANCYSTATVNGLSNVGGVAGAVDGGDISYCYATGAITGTNNWVGGIAGNFTNGSVLSNCVAINESISAAGVNINRIAGNNAGTFHNNYANSSMVVISGGTPVTITPDLNTEAGADKTLVELKTFAFYNTASNWYNGAWNINPPLSIWKICDQQGFPFLLWQNIECTTPTLSGTVTITGNAVFGQTLTASTTNLTSTPVITDLGTLSYQWKRGGADITGATNDTYTLVQADIGSTITVTVTAANCTGSVTSAATAAVIKAEQEAPDAPTLLYKTATTITLNTISGCEYRITGGAWQTSTTFVGLTPDTEYGFQARKAETATHFASAPSATTFITTDTFDEEKILQSIEQPDPITGLPNGTPKTVENLTLPQYVTLITNLGMVPGAVEWDLNACSYNPALTTEQTFTVNGTITLPVNVTNPNNIPLEVTISVTVDKENVGIVETPCIASLRVYPNPTSGELTIANYELQITSVEVFDIYGKKLSSYPLIPSSSNHLILSSSNHLINISHLPSGIYFLRIQTEKEIVIQKIIKQ